MSDSTTHSYPVMDSNNLCDKEKEEFPDAEPKKIVMTWQLKALLAGRTPLPSSRPKRKFDEMETPKSRVCADSATLEEETENVKRVDGSHSKNDKDNTIVGRIAKRPKLSNAKTSRKQWSEDEIRRVIIMRRNQVPWEQILKQFPARTLVGIRQIFWKYNPGCVFPWKKQ